MMRHYLPSVVAHSSLPDCEIVVADNGSTDDSIAMLHAEFPTVQILQLDQNYGFAEGYNRAIATLDSEYVVLLNSDVEVTPGWLSTLLDYMDAHPDTAAVMPKVLSDRDRTHFEHAGAAGGQIDLLGYPYCRGRIMDHVEEDKGQYNDAVEIFWATGACLLTRAYIYKECGGLDKDFFAHQEEIDMCWRMQCRGYHLACVPTATVYHLGGGSLSYGNPRKTFLNFRNNLLMLYKNLPTARLLWLMPVRCGLDYMAALNDLVHGNRENALAICKARIAYHQMKKIMRPKRQENLRLGSIRYPKTIRQRSIIIDFYLRHLRK